MALSKDDILAIVAAELSLTDSSAYNGTQNSDLELSLSYYLGSTPGPAPEGRSSINSTDVADSIEWIMPQVMKSFTQNNEIVVFDPVHEGDERQAEMESEYVYEVLMKQNDGFIIIHQFVKDALMQRNGILKCYYAKKTEKKSSNWTGITEEQVMQLLQQQGVELVERSEYVDENQTAIRNEQLQMQLQQMQQQMQQVQQQGQQHQMEMQQNPQMAQDPQHAQQMQQMMQQAEQQMQQLQQGMQQIQQQMQEPIILNDVVVSVERIRGKIYVDPIPPEQFRVNSMHNSINLEAARFTAHVNQMSVSDVIEMYDISLEDTDDYPEDSSYYDTAYRFQMQDESVFYGDAGSEDPSQRLIEISECFMQIDIMETGISQLMKITVAGGDTPTDIIKIEEMEHMPWVSTTCILMSHKFQGRSITDRIAEIQNQKTALWRNMMDNMYLQNNQRNVVVENQVNMDDLLVSRPGGIIRAKRLDAIMPLATPQLGQDAYQMMEYLDKVRGGRTGVDADGPATPQNIGDRVGSQGVDRLMNAKEELVGLIIRVIAETGLKPLCTMIRDLSVKHVDSVVDFKFRGQWQQIKPSEWLDRTQCTVRVGTGTGDRTAQTAAITQVITMQQQIVADSMQTLVTPLQIFTAMDDFCKFTGLNGATRYFVDPESDQGKQSAKAKGEQADAERKENKAMEQALAKAQIDLGTAALNESVAKQQSVKAKMETDTAKNELTAYKQQSDNQMNALKQQLAEAEAIAENMGKTADLDYKYHQTDSNVALELTRIEADTASEQNENYEGNKDDVSE